MEETWEKYREKIIGLGEQSSRKSYYPELQEKIDQLETSQHNLETIINSISDGIVIHDRNGVMLSLNKQAKITFNITDEDKNLYTIMDISSDKMDTSLLFPIWNQVLLGKPQMTEWIVRQINSHEDVNVHVSINRTIWNNELVLVAVIRDFSERKKYEQELIIARQKAEESDRLKSAFLANLSHEIRTPMNAIMGFSDLLHQSDLTSESRDSYIEIIHERGIHLLSIINDIIEMSKIETGQITPNVTSISLDSCVDDLFHSLKITIPKVKKIDFRLIKSPFPIQTSTDKVKLCQILTNLVSNAIKYTENGFIELSYQLFDESTIKFKVSDSGEGIDKKYHEMIFDRFNRIESDLSIKEGGSGIGLAISKAYVEMLGGSIHVESEIGKGSTFIFTLPYIPSDIKNSIPEPIRHAEITPPVVDNLILIAEDDEFSFRYLNALFTKETYQIIRAFNGKEAVEICRDRNVGLVFMDIKMPVMDGYQALKLIKSFKPDLKIIAQTAYAFPNDIIHLKQAGFDGSITKPIVKEELYEIINQLINK